MNYFKKKKIRKLAKKLRKKYKSNVFGYKDFCKLRDDLQMKIYFYYADNPHTIQRVNYDNTKYCVNFYNRVTPIFKDEKIEWLKIVYLCLFAVDKENDFFEVTKKTGTFGLIDDAEYFAHCFLMPKKRFIKNIKNNKKANNKIDFKAIARLYKLKVSTIKARTRGLGII